MRAWRFHSASRGAEKDMRIETIPLPPSSDPLPADSSLVKVLAASLNPVDVKMAEIPLIGGFIHRTPATPAFDGVGRVVKTTDGTRRVGQLVAIRLPNLSSDGVLAEYAVAAREGCMAVPDNVSPVQAATVGTCGLTAYQALATLKLPAGAQPQPRVLINGGSGGTGTYMIQVAKAMGFHVVTTCSTPNVNLCKRLGADEVIDYKKGPVENALLQMVRNDKSLQFDLVVDNVGRPWPLYKAADEYLKPGSTYVQIGGDVSFAALSQIARINFLPSFLGGGQRKWKFMGRENNRVQGEQLLNWMSEGKIQVPIDHEAPWEEVPRAYHSLKTGRTKGKIVVRVSEDI